MSKSYFKVYGNLKWLFFLLLSVSFSGSCTRKDDFTIGNYFVEEKTKLSIVDTFEVQVSTVMADSIISSGTGVMLTGTYDDAMFGSVRATSYFEPGYKSPDLDNTYIYDSACVALLYSGYSYGDTTVQTCISIYELDEGINAVDNNYFYSHHDIAFSNKLLGRKVFYPEPSGSDTLFIPVNSFGRELFTMFLNGDPDVGSSEQLIRYLKGFALTADFGNSILGFKADASQVFLRFYFHTGGEAIVNSSVTLPYGQAGKQFNTVHNDFTNTPLEKIRPDNKAIPSEETDNAAFMQAMTVLYAKITFPTLQDITFENRWRVLKAELVFAPVAGSYEKFDLPAKLCLYQTDDKNKPGKVLTSGDGSVIYSTLVTDELYDEYTGYTIDITSYLNDELADNYFDSGKGLLLNLVSGDLNKSYSRLMIQCRDHAVKLRLYYLSY